MNREECIKCINRLSDHYGVSCKFVSMNGLVGSAYVTEGRIELKKNLTPRVMLSAFFHEVGHVHCYRNNIFKVFHGTVPSTYKDNMIFRRTAYKAELWVENWAEKEMKEYFPDMEFSRSYGIDPAYEKKWVREHYSEIFNKTADL